MMHNISDSRLDAAVERFYDRMLDEFMAEDNRKCANCRYYHQGYCDLMVEEEDPVDDGNRDDDDWCEAFEGKEESFPDWMEDDD